MTGILILFSPNMNFFLYKIFFRYCIATGDAKTVFSAEDTNACCSGATCSFSMGCNGGQPSGAWNWFTKVGVTSGADYGNTGILEITNPSYTYSRSLIFYFSRYRFWKFLQALLSAVLRSPRGPPGRHGGLLLSAGVQHSQVQIRLLRERIRRQVL